MEIDVEEFPELFSALELEYDDVYIRRTGLRRKDFMATHPISQGHWDGYEVDRGEEISVAVTAGRGKSGLRCAQVFLVEELKDHKFVAETFREFFEYRKRREQNEA